MDGGYGYGWGCRVSTCKARVKSLYSTCRARASTAARASHVQNACAKVVTVSARAIHVMAHNKSGDFQSGGHRS